MNFQSIRFRLTLWYVAILGIILCSFSGFLYLTLSRSLHRDTDVRIKSIADFVASSYASPYARYGVNLDRIVEEATGKRPTGKFIQVLDKKGRIGLKSGSLGRFQLPVSNELIQELGGVEHRELAPELRVFDGKRVAAVRTEGDDPPEGFLLQRLHVLLGQHLE